MSGSVVIVTGSPGVGKSTVSARLAERAERSVHLESDFFFRFLAAGRIAPYLNEAEAQNDTVIDVIAAAARTYAEGGYLVVWDGILGPWYLDRARAGLGDVPVDYLVLRAPLDTALARIGGRGDDVDETGVVVMHPKFEDLGSLEAHVVDAAPSVDDVAARCVHMIEGGRARLTGSAGQGGEIQGVRDEPEV